MKHAILIMAHTDWPALYRLVESLNNPDIDLIIHINKKSKDWDENILDGAVRDSKIIFAPRVKVEYCNYTQVNAICSLLKTAIKGNYDYYHLISGADLPIHSVTDFLDFFSKHAGKEFVSFYNEEDINQYRYRSFFTNSIRTAPKLVSKVLTRVNRGLIWAQKKIGVNQLAGFKGTPRKCSDWWSITHQAAELILKNEREFKKHFKHVFCPSEFLAQTILFNSELKDNIYDLKDPNRGSLRLIDWERGTPYVWHNKDYKTIIESQNMFGRKFNRLIDAKIMSRIYQNRVNGAKRILVMNIGATLGGIEISLITFLKFLISEGHIVDLYLWRDGGALRPLIPKQVNIITECVRPPKKNEIKSFMDFIQYVKMHIYLILGRDCIKLFKPIYQFYDAAICYSQVGYSPYYLVDKVYASKKILYYHHGSYDYSGKQKKYDALTFDKYDIIDTISNTNKNMFTEHFPKLANKMTFSGILIDDNRILSMADADCPKIMNSSSFLICTVARISPEKGIMLALQTAKLLKSEHIDFRWVFVGDFVIDFKKECDKYIEEADIKDSIIFVGGQENPYVFMRYCNIYVQPSLVESYSITIREVAILKKPMVVTDIPAFIKAREEIVGMVVSSISAEKLYNDIVNVHNTIKSGQDLSTYLLSDNNNRIKEVIRKNLE